MIWKMIYLLELWHIMFTTHHVNMSESTLKPVESNMKHTKHCMCMLTERKML